MPTQKQEMQSFIRHYKQVTGIKEWDMHEVAKMASKMGWELPVPVTPIEMLAKAFSKAAREETRMDKQTGLPYRVNHAFKTDSKGNATLWVDIDEAPRHCIVKSATNRREQVVGDLVQLTLDLDHWNSVNPKEEPIKVILDFQEDVDWRKNGGDAGMAAA